MAKTARMQEVAIAELVPYERNAKLHGPAQIEKIKKSIEEFGFVSPILIDEDKNVIAGHGRIMAAREMGMKKVPAVFVEGLTEAQRRAYILADNRLTELAEWDMDIVTEELRELMLDGFDVSVIGFDDEPEAKPQSDVEAAQGTLAERFLVSPFTVLDTRTGWWVSRKRAWRALGIKSEIGRGNDGKNTEDGLTFAKSAQPPGVYQKKNEYEAKIGHEVTWTEFFEEYPNAGMYSTTSVFDPVLCEIAYRWFSREGGRVIDPFAGGSVRGIVASLLGRDYTGVDLSARQIEANMANWEEIPHALLGGGEAPEPKWIVGDSRNIDKLAEGEYDLLFTCPPYADLERYSDDPNDLSTMDYADFLAAYKEIIKKAVNKLKPESFAVCVVSEVRDTKGNYRNFVGDTIAAFEEAGMSYYNEAVLINNTGSAAIRAQRQFTSGRKLVRTHQNVLVFFADGELKELDVDDPQKQEEETEALIKERKGKFVQNHGKMLTFKKGDVRKAVDELGDVDVDINSEYFEVDTDV